MAGEQGQLMDIGTVAASNIAKALGLPDSAVETVKQSIRDEISAMSSHFTMAVADMQDQFEIQVRQIKSTFKYARENRLALGAAAVALLAVGFITGKIL